MIKASEVDWTALSDSVLLNAFETARGYLSDQDVRHEIATPVAASVVRAAIAIARAAGMRILHEHPDSQFTRRLI